MYISYAADLEMFFLKPLSERRNKRCRDFAEKCVKHPRNKRLFPKNVTEENKKEQYPFRKQEVFQDYFASGETYKNSANPFSQRLLNDWTNSK